MSNIWSDRKKAAPKPDRNVFDHSFQNNLTMKFGTLYPALVKEVVPGDSFKLDAAAALKAMPLQFPVQTRMRMNVHYFYVRSRTLWDKWQDWITGMDETAEFPWVKINDYHHSQLMLKTGSLGDYLGIPTTIHGTYGQTASFLGSVVAGDDITAVYSSKWFNGVTTIGTPFTNSDSGLSLFSSRPILDIFNPDVNASTANGFGFISGSPMKKKLGSTEITFSGFSGTYNGAYNGASLAIGFVGSNSNISPQNDDRCNFVISKPATSHSTSSKTSVVSLTPDQVVKVNQIFDSYPYVWLVLICNYQSGGSYVSSSILAPPSSLIYFGTRATYKSQSDFSDAAESYNYTQSPFYGANPDIRLNALPFRAYQMIYNYFYRNEQVDPFYINGDPQYNRYISNNGSGADETLYGLYRRPYELDQFTSCVPSPQFGVAPLVGVTISGSNTAEMTFSSYSLDPKALIPDPEDLESFKEHGDFSATVTLSDDDSGTITGISNYSHDIPSGNLEMLRDAITYGLSINDFRNVNSFQRFLENMQRRGYKYRDQLMSHFGVEPDYKDIDVPEFLGGFSVDVMTNQVTQTVETDTVALGDYAGQMNAIGQQGRPVEVYCPEHGYLMAIASISPVPNYSQCLPKFFTKTSNKLDYYFPEFSKVGMQPVPYRELCPLQVYAAGDDVDDTFGYQMNNYDYKGSYDEVHGDFRTSLRDYLVSRRFDSKPVLGHDFITINPDDVNNIFSVTTDDDKFLGQIYFKIIAKRPMPRYGTPALE